MTKADFFRDRTYWIIGASDGIGAALAEELSGRGAKLILSSRRAEALAKVADRCPGPVDLRVLDIGDTDAMGDVLDRIEQDHGPLDGAICVAALYDPAAVADMDLTAAERILRVNLLGSLGFAKLVPPSLRSGGQLVLFGSVAGYFGLPGGQPYSATKAAIANLAESLRVELAPTVDVRLVSPGFVRTRLTDKNDFTMPDLVEPEDAARQIADGLASKAFEIHFPKRFTRRVKLLRALPYAWAFRIVARITSDAE